MSFRREHRCGERAGLVWGDFGLRDELPLSFACEELMHCLMGRRSLQNDLLLSDSLEEPSRSKYKLMLSKHFNDFCVLDSFVSITIRLNLHSLCWCICNVYAYLFYRIHIDSPQVARFNDKTNILLNQVTYIWEAWTKWASRYIRRFKRSNHIPQYGRFAHYHLTIHKRE